MTHIKQKFVEVMMVITNRLTPSCDTITRKISESMDHRLSFRERFQIRFHTMMCTFCNRYRKQLMALHTMVAGGIDRFEQEEEADAPGLSPEARERIRNALADPGKHH